MVQYLTETSVYELPTGWSWEKLEAPSNLDEHINTLIQTKKGYELQSHSLTPLVNGKILVTIIFKQL